MVDRTISLGDLTDVLIIDPAVTPVMQIDDDGSPIADDQVLVTGGGAGTMDPVPISGPGGLITATAPIIESSGAFGLDYNTTNLRVTASQLNTIQDIATASSPTFSALTVTGATILNNAGGDNDTQIKGQTNDFAFFVDASTGFVSIGKSNPVRELEVFGLGNVFIRILAGTGTSPALELSETALTWTIKNDASVSNNLKISSSSGGAVLILDTSGSLSITGKLVLPKASGNGIKVDLATPTFGFADLLGRVTSINQGASKPTLTTYRDSLLQFQFAAGKEDYFEFHLPHDYVKGTDIFLHFHWSHTSTIVTGGTALFEYELSYSKSHNQAVFPASVSGTITGTASTNQYQQILSETQISATSPSGSQIDTDDLEPDGVILMRAGLQTNNITSSGAVPDPFIHYVDIHYQSTGLIGTKDKAPDFYN